MKAFIKKHYIPFTIFILVGLAVFLPILFDINHKILGNDPNGKSAQDGIQFIWNFWWAKKTCLGLCGDFWNTAYQFFPAGSSLLFQNFSFPSLIIMLPFMLLGLSAVGAYNFSLLFALIFSCFFAYLLIYHLTKNRIASFISGIIYGLSPFIIGHIFDGQLDLVTIQFFPLLFLLLIKADENKKIIYQIASGIILFVIALSSPTFIIFIPFVLGAWLIYKIITEPKNFKVWLKKISIIFFIFLIPFLLFFYKNLAEIKSFNLNGSTKWNSELSSAELLAFVTPPQTTILGKTFFEKNYENFKGIYSDKSLYLGFSILTLSMLGIILQRKKWQKIFLWAFLGISAFIFSLGPKLYINGKVIISSMPFSFLEKLPGFDMLRAPSRFSLFIFLSLAVLSGYGISYLIKKLKNKRMTLIAVVGIIALVIFEYFPFHQYIRTLSIPKAYEKIKEDNKDFAIIEYPLLWISGLENKGLAFSQIENLYYQTFHEKKMAGGYLTRMDNKTFESYTKNPLLKYIVGEKNRMSLSKETIDTIEKYKSNNEYLLKDNPFKYLVINKKEASIYNSSALSSIDFLKNNLKENLIPLFKDEEIEIYVFK